MTLPDFTQLLITVGVGAGATLITLKISMAKIEERMQASDERIREGFDAFRLEAQEIGKAVGHLAETVARQAVMVDGMENLFERLRLVESDVAVLKSKRRT